MNEVQSITASRSAIESIERAQIDIQIATAQLYPKHSPGRPASLGVPAIPNQLTAIKQNIMTMATENEDIAASCFFTLPRGGKSIQGKSVRLAEIAVPCYGNLRIATRIIDVVTTGENPHVVIQAVSHDLENNVGFSIEKQRRIVKKRSKAAIDEDDIQLAINACTSIAYRDVAFKTIPSAVTELAYEMAKKVAIGDVKSLAKKRQQVIDRLKQMGVTEDRILAALGCKTIDDISGEILGELIGIGVALKDGETSIEEAFPPIKFNDKNKATANSNAAGAEKIGDVLQETPAGKDLAEEAKRQVEALKKAEEAEKSNNGGKPAWLNNNNNNQPPQA